ncbi:MAG: 23S rRNA (uracil(1939)-C(5))-methyltransferase RlmD [Caldilineae bacterium]|nr:23S rRNA (uracil(1939)-C(5))-methyltransferase RlmD [Caldilineae bacterium]
MPTTIHLTGIAHGGEAFGHHDGKIVFVPYTIPGETVEVEIVEEKARWARARLLHVVEPSPDRVDAPCPYFGPGLCGGCQWQHIDYERQLELKREVVADQLKRLGRVADPPVEELIALADDDGLLDLGYRNHVQMVADVNGALGFIRDAEGRTASDDSEDKHSRDMIAVDRCLLLHPLVDELHQALVEGRLAPVDLPEGSVEGEDDPVRLRKASLRAGIHTGQRLMLIETVGARQPPFAVEDLPVRVAFRERDGSVVPLIGDPWLEEEVAGRTFRCAADGFFQVNTIGAEAMVDLALEMLAPQGHETLLDGYCGVGLFALSLARSVGQVIAVEESWVACEDFAWNARDVDNVALFEGPFAEVLETFDAEERIHLAIIDPPRSGAGAEAVAQLVRLGVPRLLYVSCDPATLARDARLLVEAGYELQQVQPLDMFPQTYHIESLALFTLRTP